MKKSLLSLVLLLMELMVPVTATAAYDQLADGVYQDGTTLYITSGVTSLGDLQVNPSEIYCYATIPPACVSNTFSGYDATLHVPAAGMVSYFTTLYWYNFNNILSDAIEPLSITMNTAEAELEIDQQLSLSATVAPSDATPKTVYWSSTDTSVATVSGGGTVTAVAAGECDILATCLNKVAACHVTISTPYVTIILDKHEVQLLPNHTITLTATCSPIDVDLSVTSNNPRVAIPRLVNGAIMVVGVAEGTATITVNAADGYGNPDLCSVTVYTEHGDINCDGYVNMDDLTNMINYLLTNDVTGINLTNADTNLSGDVTMDDLTTLINYLLTDRWPWQHDMTFNVNGVSFTMVYVEGGTFTMGATTDQEDDAEEYEKPMHTVELSDYRIGQTEVTQALWQAVMGYNPSRYTGDFKRPVEQVSWNDCQTFICKLNEMTGQHFRLLSEAEWEYAARGGKKSQGFKFSGSNNVADVAWYYDNSNNTTHPVATKLSNELGIYDMSGNVYEWCQDWFGIDYYSNSSVVNPIGPTSGVLRVDRGGCYESIVWGERVSARFNNEPDETIQWLGLRLALDPDNSPKFRLSETVMRVMPGENKSVDIFHGDGDYTLAGGPDNASITFSGNSLTVMGTNEGTSTVYVINNATGATAVLTIIVDAEHEYVDLGLPSGTLWATMNIGASRPEEYGDYFAWGETEPKEVYDWSTYWWCNGSYDTLTKYCTSISFGSVDNKTVLDPVDDAAYVNWGPSWRIPSDEQNQELINLCTWKWTTKNGVKGYLVTGPNGNTLFLPAAGFRSSSSLVNVGINGCYWSRSIYFAFPNAAYGIYFSSESVNRHDSGRSDGANVRAVRRSMADFYIEQQNLDFGFVPVEERHTSSLTIVNNTAETITLTASVEDPFSFIQKDDTTSSTIIVVPSLSSVQLMVVFNGSIPGQFNNYVTIQNTADNGTQIVIPVHVLAYANPSAQQEDVDLGLPSGTLWATCNVGATSPEEYGDYFAWGEISPDNNNYYTWQTYEWSYGDTQRLIKYCTWSVYGQRDDLTELLTSDDAAYVNMGTSWRIPTKDQLSELGGNCTWLWTTMNSVNGYLVIGPNCNTIFLPAAGYRTGGSLKDAGSDGYYWSLRLVNTTPINAYYLYFDSISHYSRDIVRYVGLTVRGVRR